MKRIALLILAVVLVVGVLLTLNGDASAGKKKGKKTPSAGGTGAVTQMADSRYVATIPNFTVAAGSYIIPNSDTVTTNFVLQGDNTGSGGWVTIPVTEYELFAKSGYIAQRPLDLVSGAGVDWDAYETANGGGGYRLSAYTKSVSGTRTSYTNESIAFANTETGYSPIGLVGEMNGEALKNAIVNLLVAGGAKVVADDLGLTIIANGSSYLFFRATDGEGIATISANKNTNINSFSLITTNADGQTADTSLSSALDSSDATLRIHSEDNKNYATLTSGNGTFLGMVIGADIEPALSDGAGLDIDGKLIRIRTSKTPSSASDTGNAGEIAWDSNYIYVCVATDTWKRVAISTW